MFQFKSRLHALVVLLGLVALTPLVGCGVSGDFGDDDTTRTVTVTVRLDEDAIRGTRLHDEVVASAYVGFVQVFGFERWPVFTGTVSGLNFFVRAQFVADIRAGTQLTLINIPRRPVWFAANFSPRIGTTPYTTIGYAAPGIDAVESAGLCAPPADSTAIPDEDFEAYSRQARCIDPPPNRGVAFIDVTDPRSDPGEGKELDSVTVWLNKDLP